GTPDPEREQHDVVTGVGLLDLELHEKAIEERLDVLNVGSFQERGNRFGRSLGTDRKPIGVGDDGVSGLEPGSVLMGFELGQESQWWTGLAQRLHATVGA